MTTKISRLFETTRGALDALASGKISAVELAEDCLARAAASGIGAFSELMPERALEDARRIDGWRSTGSSLSAPLFGLPVAVKENIDTVPAACSAGLAFRENWRPDRDADVVRLLREAGAVVIGVTTTDPGAFDVRTPQVIHPLDPSLSVGGSSGGSAAALAAGLCYGALGTDTGGSVRIPSACCGTVGMKPTRSLLSLEGVFPLVPSLDHVGPMSFDVNGLAILLRALVDRPQLMPAAKVRSVGFDPAYFADADDQVQVAFAAMLQRCAEAGLECHRVSLPNIDEISEMHLSIFCLEVAALHLSSYEDYELQYPASGRAMFEYAKSMSAQSYVDARRKRDQFTRQVSLLFDRVDVILAPTLPVLRPIKSADRFKLGNQWLDFTFALVRYTCLFDHTGHPVVAMPLKGEGEVSPSVQIVGPLQADWKVLQFAEYLEALLKRERCDRSCW